MSEDLAPEDRDLARSLSERRPVPRGTFRGSLGRLLAQRDPGFGPRPERLVLLVILFVVCGLALIAVGALVALS